MISDSMVIPPVDLPILLTAVAEMTFQKGSTPMLYYIHLIAN